MSVSPRMKPRKLPNPKPPARDTNPEEEPATFHFKEITPEDWRANEAPLADLYQRGIVSSEYVRQRLKIPDEAGQGTMFTPPPTPPPASSDIKQPEERRIPSIFESESYEIEGGWFRRRSEQEN